MQNEVTEIGEEPRLQIFISAQFDATVTITSPIVGTYTKVVRANTVHVETMRSDHVNTTSEVIQRKAVFITSDVPIVVYALNTLAQSTDSYTAIPIKHLGTNYRTVNRGTDRYSGTQFFNQLPRVGEFMVMAVEDNTVVTINTPVPTLKRQRAISTTLRKGDCYLVQALPTATGADDLTASEVISSKPVALLSGHVRSSVPTVTSNSKDHLVEQLPPIDKWGKTYATAPMLLKSTVQRPDLYRLIATVPDQQINVRLQNTSFVWKSVVGRMWFDTTFREPAYWYSDSPFLLVQHMPSGGLNLVNFDPAMVVVTPIEQFVNSALFQFPTLEVNDNIINQQFLYFLNVIASPEALATLKIDTTRVAGISPQIASQVIPGTNLHWAQLELAEGSHVISADSGLFSGVMYGTSAADSYANMVGVAYEPQRKRDVSPPKYALAVDCGVVFGEIRDVSSDTAKLGEVYVVSAQTRNYRWTITPVDDSNHVVLFEAAVIDPLRDAQLVIHAYDDRGNGREWKYLYDAPALSYAKSITIDRKGSGASCTTLVVRNVDTTSTRISSVYIVGDSRITVDPQIRDTVLRAKDSLVLRICITAPQDPATISAVVRIQLPCQYLTANVITRSNGMIQGSAADLGDVRIGDTACTNLSVVNTGSKSIILTSMMLAQMAKGLTLDTTGLLLPRTMKPGDQVWVRACFTPTDTGRVTRVDSVYSNEAGTAVLEVRGRGVRPRVESVIVDWGKRRVGSQNDTTVYVRNTGSCKAMVGATLTSFTRPFVSLQNSLADAVLGMDDSIAVRLRFAPYQRGSARDSQQITVDWKYHEPVQILLRGVGVLPELKVHNVDMGQLQVGQQRDSIVEWLELGQLSDAPLVIDSVRVVGPDSSAFQLPTSLTGLSGYNLVVALLDSVRFTPTRIGPHVCAVLIYHNGGERLPALDTLYVTGIGLPNDSAIVTVGLKSDAQIVRCGQAAATLEISNTGTARAVLQRVRLIIGADTTDVHTPTDPLIVAPGVTWTHSVAMTPSSGSELNIVVLVIDSAGNEIRREYRIDVIDPRAGIELGWDSLPSPPSVKLLTGDHAMILAATITDIIELSSSPVIIADVPHERFAVGNSIVTARLVTEAGMASTRVIFCTIRQSDSGIAVSYPEIPKTPWECVIAIPGQILWKDQRQFTARARLAAQPCLDDVMSQPIDIATVPCGSKTREVTFGEVPRVTVRPLLHPFDDVVSLEVESTFETPISIVVQTLSGQEFFIPKRFTLQKGIQHCNFSCSDWMPGLYRLVIFSGADVLDRKIIIVN